MKKIALLVDFTGVCQLAMEHAALLTRQSLSQLVLLHVAPPSRSNEEKAIVNEIRDFASKLDDEGIPFSVQVDFGDFFQIIGQSITKLGVDLIIVGTHGIKGISKDFLGSNVLRLIRQLNIPSLIVQGHCQPPHEGYLNILVPLLGKIHDVSVMNRFEDFASVFHSKIHFLGYYNSENKEEVHKQNKELAERTAAAGYATETEEDESSLYTSSFSKSIIEYADIQEIQLIVLLIYHNDENYFNDFDKENLLLNRLGKAVLCI